MKWFKIKTKEYFSRIKTVRKKITGWYYFKDPSIRIHGRIKVINRRRITIGSNCALNDGVLIDPGEKLVIGNNVVISPHAMILGSDLAPKAPTKHCAGTVIVEDDVWIGAGSIILKNTRIGKGAVVGAGSVVTRDVPPQAVVAGNPASVIKERSSG